MTRVSLKPAYPNIKYIATIPVNGVTKVSPDGDLTVLTSTDPKAVNTLKEPAKVAPVTSKVKDLGAQHTESFAPNSVNVLKIQTK
jgi:alpha-L-arabinofuranosidase